jgi:hypothetical protein
MPCGNMKPGSQPSATSEVAEKPRYCYSCRREHPPGHPMRRVETRQGYRWRCQATLDAARLGPAARDALGREKSEANRLATRRAMEHYNQYRAPRSEG